MRSGTDCKGKDWTEVCLSGYMKDITGLRSGRLIALFPVLCNGVKQWLCLCDCGNLIVVPCNKITLNNTKSCGCLQKEITSNRWKKHRDESNIIGERFGRLTTSKFLRIENQEAIYLFSCDCGNSIECSMHSVKQGNTKSCGCLKHDLIESYEKDIIGKRFGKLLVESCVGTNNHGEHEYLCICSCGGAVIVSRSGLVRGLVQSCGCLRSVGENNIKYILSAMHVEYKQQYTFPDLLSKAGRLLPYDFAIFDNCGHVVRLIEFDGPQHNKSYEYFGGEEKFAKVQENDFLKNQYALSHDIPLVRIPYSKRDSITKDDLMDVKYLIS